MKAIIEDEMADDGVKLRVLFNSKNYFKHYVGEIGYFYFRIDRYKNIDSENIKLQRGKKRITFF